MLVKQDCWLKVSKLPVATKGRPRRSVTLLQKYDLKHKNLISKCSLISSSMIEDKSNYTFKILQVFETLMQLTTQNNESVSYDKTQIGIVQPSFLYEIEQKAWV